MSFASATIKAEVKQNSGTGVARAIRRENKVPAVIYGKGKTPIMVAIVQRELVNEYQKGRFFSRIVEIEAGGKKMNVLPQDMQMDPVKDVPIHADFIIVDAKSRVKVSVPVQFANQDKAPGIKKGGILNAVRRAIDVYCNADAIPEKFVADLTGLQIGGNVKWHNINVPKDVESVIRGRDFTIATIAGRMAEEEIPTTAPTAAVAAVPGAPAAPGAAPAAGATAPAAGATAPAAAKPDAKKK
jgi:large subunit ribosomal protein L25